jgi:hypothetical protein
MTIVDSIVSRLTRFSSWLFSRHWERWEILIIIAFFALFLLLLVLRTMRKAKINAKSYTPQYTSTIGIRLAHREVKNQKPDDLRAVV